jgi:hypothetical protein
MTMSSSCVAFAIFLCSFAAFQMATDQVQLVIDEQNGNKVQLILKVEILID